MRVRVKCFATLSSHNPPEGLLELAQGTTIQGMLPTLGLGDSDIKLVFVNSKNCALDTVLADGDQVGLFPAVGGG